MIMSRRRHRRFTESQLEQHQSFGYQLQRVNAIAAQGLIKLHRLSPAHQHYEQAYRDLAEAVRSMKLHSHCCESIVANSWVTYTRINIIQGNVCEHCLVNPKSANDSYGQVKLFKKLNPNPGWRIQVEALFLLPIWRSIALLSECLFSLRRGNVRSACAIWTRLCAGSSCT